MTEIAVLSGGVGAARFLLGLLDAVDPSGVTAVVNTGDDTVFHGLSISPDIDTIVYTLAGAIDPERGWGLDGETWAAMEALDRYAAVRPDHSSAAPRWFNLGDRDLATHFYRTARLREGASLTETTDEIRRAWDVPCSIVPMSDGRLSTLIDVIGHGELPFQDYFVRLRHSLPIRGIRFDGQARPSAATLGALQAAATVVIAPSNPLVSIAPIRSLAGVDDALASRRDRVVAISPIVGGAALKGPAGNMMTELGLEASVVGVARLYASVASALVIDPLDAHLAADVEAAGMRPVVVPSVMTTPEIARDLALSALDTVR